MSDNLELTHVSEQMEAVGDYYYGQPAENVLISPMSSHRCPRRELKLHMLYHIPTGFIDLSRYLVEGLLCDVFCENPLIAANFCYLCEVFYEDLIEMGLHITRYRSHTLVCGICHRVFQDFNKLTEFQPILTSFPASLEQHLEQCAHVHMFTPPPSLSMTTDTNIKLRSSREGSQDYDMEEDDSDVLLKTLEELEQVVPGVESNDWQADYCQAEE